VRKPPPITDLPKEGSFTRVDCILGIYCRVIRILLHYSPEDFHSRYLFLYPLGGLAKNLRLLMKENQAEMKICVVELADKYRLDQEEKNQLLAYMD
jgi:hypothetical protein